MSSDESETNDGSSDSSHELKKKKKHKHREKKHKKKKNKHSSDQERKKRKKKKRKSSKDRKEGTKKIKLNEATEDEEDMPGPSIPDHLLIESSKAKAPMTKEEWEKSQNVVRRVYDETGRSRLIKGDGEILEEIVSRDRHREINRQATLGDGLYFQNKLMKK